MFSGMSSQIKAIELICLLFVPVLRIQENS